MCNTDSDELRRSLGEEIDRIFVSLTATVAAERVTKLTAERKGRLLRLNDQKVSDEIHERR